MTWPGNRKELLTAIPIAYVLALKSVISFSDLPHGEQFLGRLVTPWTRLGNRKELLAVIPIAYVLALQRVISFSDLPRGEQFLGRLVTPLTWPGNRKELLAAILIAYMLAMKRVIGFSDLPRCEQFLGRLFTPLRSRATGRNCTEFPGRLRSHTGSSSLEVPYAATPPDHRKELQFLRRLRP